MLFRSNGTITELKILDGGQNYDKNYLRVFVIGSGSGYGFEADTTNAQVENGVIKAIEVIDPGEGYAAEDYNVTIVAGTGGSGTDLNASVDSSDVKDGIITVALDDGGSGYTTAPAVILRGGKLEEYEYPYSFIEETKIVLEADAFDPDGVVQEVRFYGNGKLLGSAPLGNVESIEVVNPGSNFGATPPTVTISGGGGSGAEAEAVLDANGNLVQEIGRAHV